MTPEPELTEPVDLCTPDGAFLNPAALGWSRRPLHRANLHGRPGENKRWDYWAILAGDLVVSVVYSNVDRLGIAAVWWVHLPTGRAGGHGVAVPGGEGMPLPELPGAVPLRLDRQGLDLEIADDSDGTHIRADWREWDGRPARLDVDVALPAGHDSLNVVIPWSDRQFNFTSKHWARPARGALTVGDRSVVIGGTGGQEAWGVLDVGRGRWPSEIRWNWGGGAGRCGGHVIGLQVGAKWTEGTGFTENGILVDGRLTKLGAELDWDYDWDRPLEPWRVTDPGGQLDMVLTGRYDRHQKIRGRKRGSETHQVFGTWSGRLCTDDGRELEFRDIQGFAEEARQRW